MHPYSSIDTTAAWKKFHFILSDRLDFHMINSLSITVHAFARRVLMSLSVNEMLLPRYVDLFTNFRKLLFRLKNMYSVWSGFTMRPMFPAACSRLCSRDSAGVGAFTPLFTSKMRHKVNFFYAELTFSKTSCNIKVKSPACPTIHP